MNIEKLFWLFIISAFIAGELIVLLVIFFPDVFINIIKRGDK